MRFICIRRIMLFEWVVDGWMDVEKLKVDGKGLYYSRWKERGRGTMKSRDLFIRLLGR